MIKDDQNMHDKWNKEIDNAVLNCTCLDQLSLDICIKAMLTHHTLSEFPDIRKIIIDNLASMELK